MADLTQNALNVSASNQAVIRREYPAGAVITGGQVVYLDANNRWQLADANAPLGMNVGDTVGIALHNTGNTQPLSVCTSDPNFGIGATVTNGVIYCASPNAGGIAPSSDMTTGNYPLVLGPARSTSRINLNPTPAGVSV